MQFALAIQRHGAAFPGRRHRPDNSHLGSDLGLAQAVQGGAAQVRLSWKG
ncbi:hypothetical protein CFter6_1560 [Collimonas fungivorans]|uniref:Uncharacterized protein n=1 Tax=Collimonas fungivorans TaxID=158899 RepID=A0A127P9E6_9BURK|nr:hypothetical protein CFter6_1560 [Collimonas fungivorans]